MNNVGKGQDRIKDLLATKVPNSVLFQSWITNYRPTTLIIDRARLHYSSSAILDYYYYYYYYYSTRLSNNRYSHLMPFIQDSSAIALSMG